MISFLFEFLKDVANLSRASNGSSIFGVLRVAADLYWTGHYFLLKIYYADAYYICLFLAQLSNLFIC